MRRQQKRLLAESQSLRESIAALEDKVQRMALESKQDAVPAAVYSPFKGLNVHKRAEALRMYRHGSDRRKVADALGLPPAEVALLEKVYQLLNCNVAA